MPGGDAARQLSALRGYFLSVVDLGRMANKIAMPIKSAAPPIVGIRRSSFCWQRLASSRIRIGDAKYARETTPRPVNTHPMINSAFMRIPWCSEADNILLSVFEQLIDQQ